MNKGYKGNRANATQIEDNYIRGQIKVLKEKYERWERVNKKLQDKGLEPKYTNEINPLYMLL